MTFPRLLTGCIVAGLGYGVALGCAISLQHPGSDCAEAVQAFEERSAECGNNVGVSGWCSDTFLENGDFEACMQSIAAAECDDLTASFSSHCRIFYRFL